MVRMSTGFACWLGLAALRYNSLLSSFLDACWTRQADICSSAGFVVKHCWLPLDELLKPDCGPHAAAYWDVETNLTIVGLSLWTRQEQWAQGIVKAASTNGDGSVQVTVASDVGYDHSIW